MKLAAILTLVMATVASNASAQTSFPRAPIRVIVPYSAGGGTDLVARTVTGKLSERVGQPVIVDNRPGGATIVGTESAIRSAPDGYTLLFHSGTVTIDPSYKKNLSYDLHRDLIPITKASNGGFAILIPAAVPATTLTEFIAYAKANPGKLNFGSPGVGTSVHLATESFMAMTGIQLVHVPYRGAGPAITGLITNQIQLLLDPVFTAQPHVESGSLRALAVSSRTRSRLLPNVPTAKEAGLAGYESGFWGGFFAPAKTPSDVIQTLSTELRASLRDPAIEQKLVSQGLEVVANTPEQFTQELKDETAHWAKVIRDAKIEPE